jgi:hypothetical protein
MTDFVEVKTSNLEFGALDWSIAQIEGLKVELTPPNYGHGIALVFVEGSELLYRPSIDWSLAGPLIDKHHVNLHSPQNSDDCWAAWVTIRGKDFAQGGYQPMKAACRAIVAAKQGDTVSIPAELVKP